MSLWEISCGTKQIDMLCKMSDKLLLICYSYASGGKNSSPHSLIGFTT